MKTLLKIFFLGVLTALLTFAAMAKETPRAKPGYGKDKGFFIFKADRKLIGANVKILKSNGTVIAEQVLKKRKLVIDFNDIKSGSYTIRIVKDENIQEFTYYKE
jgi:hypothetical protein